MNSKRKNSSIPINMRLGDRESSCKAEASELFAKHFASVFEAHETSDSEIESAVRDVPLDLLDLSTFVITEEMVIAASIKLKNSVCPGPDGIPATVYRRCSSALAKPLAAIFNRSLNHGQFPALWKQSFMFPVFKSGDRRDVTNYRGITSLCAASKLFEIILSKAVLNNSKCYISTDQHGFIPGRSVVTNLLEFTSTCLTAMEQNTQVDVVYTDLKAAFDKIDHRILISKLARLGASATLTSWLHSYLTDRTLRVQLDSYVSEPFTSLSGVPQGSNLGPLLFTLFFNDVAALLGAKVKLVYADDLKLYLVVRTVEDCHQLQNLLDLFVSWCRRNKLIVSIPKCVVMTFHRNKDPIVFNYRIDGTLLRRVDQVNDLGVLLDPKLDFRLHYSSVISKANRQLGFISKIARDFKDPHCLKALYCSLVRPILENASIVWCPYEMTWILRLERVQKRFVRLALRNLPWRDPVNLPPYPNRCLLLDLETLEQRRKIQQATFVAKLLNGEVDCPVLLSQLNFRVPHRSLRNNSLLQLSYHRTAYGYNEPLTAVIRVFSSMESLFEFGESSNTFRNRIRRNV